jgi:hypothetical protein
MAQPLSKLLDTESLDELKRRLAATDAGGARQALLTEYQRLFTYRNIVEWNALVRVCEALALLGWGDAEPAEALAMEEEASLRHRALARRAGNGPHELVSGTAATLRVRH